MGYVGLIFLIVLEHSDGLINIFLPYLRTDPKRHEKVKMYTVPGWIVTSCALFYGVTYRNGSN